jgi:hypothetical protein
MRNIVVRGAVLVIGVLLLLGGLAALAEPARLAGSLGITAAVPLGAASLRADLFGFFATAGIMAIAAAIRRAPAMLTAPLLLIGLALIGRCVALAFQPFDHTLLPPMIAETFMAAVFTAGRFMSARA